MRIPAVLTIGLVLAGGMIPAYAAQGPLNPQAMRDWVIVPAEDAIPSETYAAKEFQSLFHQAAGIELPVAAKAQPSKNIFIGAGAAMKASPVGFSVEDLGEEGLRIRVTPENIAIAGGRPRGTLYGVYEFMERYAGVRFLTHDHTYIPEKKSWKIPIGDFTYIPPFAFRWSYYKENADHPEFAARLRVNTTTNDEKLGGVCRQSLISHTLHHYLPVEKYGKEHPEYFALVDGERKLEMWGGGPEPCVTNPEVIEIVAENVISDLDRHPGMQNVSVSQNDNDAYCRCENCEAINQREGTPMGSHLAFVNAVAERVEKAHPGVMVGTLAYWYTRKPPKTIKPRPNVQIQLCSIECCTLHPIDDPTCEKNREFCRDMEEWGKICDHIWVWNYNTNFRYYDLPFPNLRVISPNVQYFLKNHAKGLFMQANGNGNTGELCDLRNYVMARCIWNPELDSWELAKEFCRLHYGRSANVMIRYLTYVHDNAETSGFHPTCFPQPFEVGMTPKSAKKIYGLFQKALAKAENEAVRNRVEKASIASLRAVLETCGIYDVQNGILRVRYPELFGDLAGRYKELTRKHDQTRAEEWETIDHYYNLLDRATLQGFPARKLENASWSMTILPEENGKLIELRHKPSRRDLLMPAGYRSLRNAFDYLTLQELMVQGAHKDDPAAFQVESTGSSVHLSKILADGSLLERTIRLADDPPDAVRFETRITHKGSEAKTYRFRIHPEWFTGTVTQDDHVVSAYIKDQEWVKFNQNWTIPEKRNVEILQTARGGGYAFFNHKERYGLLLSYDPLDMERAAFEWNSQYPMAALDLFTNGVELKPGETFDYGYTVTSLAKPPM